jgi:putative transposase
MRRFKSAGHAQRFSAAYGPIACHFRPRRYQLRARNYREVMRQRFQSWREITDTSVAA